MLAQNFSKIILEQLYKWGISIIFAIPGAHVDALLKMAAEDGRFEIILGADEQGAGSMADGFARAAGKPAAVISINGPGATNLITSVVSARIDHSPVFFITGDSPLIFKGFGSFQSSDPEESNAAGIMKEAIGHSYQINDSHNLAEAFKCFEDSMQSPLPYPVHINLPCDVAGQNYEQESKFSINDPYKTVNHNSWKSTGTGFPEQIGKKAAILLGDQIRSKDDIQLIVCFAKEFSLPLALTLSSKNYKSLIPENLYLGIFGYAGGLRARKALLDPELDTLFMIGADFDERTTMVWDERFLVPTRKIIRISLKEDFHKKLLADIIELKNMKIKESLDLLRAKWSKNKDQSEISLRRRWIESLNALPLISYKDEKIDISGDFTLKEALLTMNEMFPEGSSFFLDSGDHRIQAALYWNPKEAFSLFTSPKLAAMGWAIAAGIGASFAKKERPVWVLTGDGCMLMQGMNIAVAAKHKCKTIFFVSNNQSYGRIAARLQNDPELIREKLSGIPKISWKGYAESLGVQSSTVNTKDELAEAIRKANFCEGPYLIDLKIVENNIEKDPEVVFTSASEKIIQQRKLKTKENER